MTEQLVYSLLAINVLTFVVYGVDKLKAKKHRRRISEATLLWMAALGGAMGAMLGMRMWHHKTLHLKFRYGVPALLLAQIAAIAVLFMNNQC